MSDIDSGCRVFLMVLMDFKDLARAEHVQSRWWTQGLYVLACTRGLFQLVHLTSAKTRGSSTKYIHANALQLTLSL